MAAEQGPRSFGHIQEARGDLDRRINNLIHRAGTEDGEQHPEAQEDMMEAFKFLVKSARDFDAEVTGARAEHPEAHRLTFAPLGDRLANHRFSKEVRDLRQDVAGHIRQCEKLLTIGGTNYAAMKELFEAITERVQQQKAALTTILREGAEAVQAPEEEEDAAEGEEGADPWRVPMPAWEDRVRQASVALQRMSDRHRRPRAGAGAPAAAAAAAAPAAAGVPAAAAAQAVRAAHAGTITSFLDTSRVADRRQSRGTLPERVRAAKARQEDPTHRDLRPMLHRMLGGWVVTLTATIARILLENPGDKSWSAVKTYFTPDAFRETAEEREHRGIMRRAARVLVEAERGASMGVYSADEKNNNGAVNPFSALLYYTAQLALPDLLQALGDSPAADLKTLPRPVIAEVNPEYVSSQTRASVASLAQERTRRSQRERKNVNAATGIWANVQKQNMQLQKAFRRRLEGAGYAGVDSSAPNKPWPVPAGLEQLDHAVRAYNADNRGRELDVPVALGATFDDAVGAMKWIHKEAQLVVEENWARVDGQTNAQKSRATGVAAFVLQLTRYFTELGATQTRPTGPLVYGPGVRLDNVRRVIDQMVASADGKHELARTIDACLQAWVAAAAAAAPEPGSMFSDDVFPVSFNGYTAFMPVLFDPELPPQPSVDPRFKEFFETMLDAVRSYCPAASELRARLPRNYKAAPPAVHARAAQWYNAVSPLLDGKTFDSRDAVLDALARMFVPAENADARARLSARATEAYLPTNSRGVDHKQCVLRWVNAPSTVTAMPTRIPRRSLEEARALAFASGAAADHTTGAGVLAAYAQAAEACVTNRIAAMSQNAFVRALHDMPGDNALYKQIKGWVAYAMAVDPEAEATAQERFGVRYEGIYTALRAAAGESGEQFHRFAVNACLRLWLGVSDTIAAPQHDRPVLAGAPPTTAPVPPPRGVTMNPAERLALTSLRHFIDSYFMKNAFPERGTRPRSPGSWDKVAEAITRARAHPTEVPKRHPVPLFEGVANLHGPITRPRAPAETLPAAEEQDEAPDDAPAAAAAAPGNDQGNGGGRVLRGRRRDYAAMNRRGLPSPGA